MIMRYSQVNGSVIVYLLSVTHIESCVVPYYHETLYTTDLERFTFTARCFVK